MRAVVYERYGPPEVLHLREVEQPVKMGIPHYPKEDVLLVKELMEAGNYRAVIDRRYPLEDVIEASRYVETGQKTGNVA